MKPRIALLWDIDGTLLTTNGLGRGPLLDAIQCTTGYKGDHDLATGFGLTDHQIVNNVIKCLEISDKNPDELIDDVLEDYCTRYEVLLQSKKITILNGVDGILRVLNSHGNVMNMICTGNVIKGAKIKLNNVGLDKFFAGINYFCSENLGNRSEIVARAKRAAIEQGYDPIVIGDTIHDIEAAKINGIKCIALESESYPVNLLNEATPHALLRLGWHLKHLENAIYAT
jgi:phosphoglycolate phosphatase-like HAD superfamily hydrolase